MRGELLLRTGQLLPHTACLLANNVADLWLPVRVSISSREGRHTLFVLLLGSPALLRAALLREREALRHCLFRLPPSLRVQELGTAISGAAGHCVRAGKLDCRDGAAAQGDKQETSRRQPT